MAVSSARARRLAGAAALAAAAAAFTLSSASAGPLTVVQKQASLERAIVWHINEVRAAHGLRRLRYSPRLAVAGKRHAWSLAKAGYFSHDQYTPRRPSKWTPFGRWITRYWPGRGYSSWRAGENLAWGAPTIDPQDIVRRWLESPGHRENVLDPGWRRIGISAVHVTNPTGHYAPWQNVTITAVEFGVRSS
jgi:uncharacterized protein YkwD